MFFHSWQEVVIVVVTGIVTYLGLIASLRITGKRTLATLNAFDLVVTVAIGSILASTILSEQVAIVEGITAMLTLMLLQYIISWLSVKYENIATIVRAEPTLLFYQGEFLEDAMRKRRIIKDEIRQIVRSNGYAHVHEVDAVIMETNGNFSVIRNFKNGDSLSALSSIQNYSSDMAPSNNSNHQIVENGGVNMSENVPKQQDHKPNSDKL